MDFKSQKKHLIKLLYFCVVTAFIYICFRYVIPIVMPLIIAFFIAFLIQKPAGAISRKTGISSKGLAVVFVGIFYLVIISLAILLGSLILNQASQLFSAIPEIYSDSIEPQLTKLSLWIKSTFTGDMGNAGTILLQSLPDILSSVSSGALNFISSAVMSLPSLFISFGITFIATFMIAFDYKNITDYLLLLLNSGKRKQIITLKSGIVSGMSKMLKSYLTIFIIDICELTVGLTLLGTEYAVIVALIVALADMVPLVGAGIIMLPWTFVELISGNIPRAVGLAIIFSILSLTRSFIEPRIVGRQIGIHPVFTLCGMYIGMRLFGFWGLLFLPFIFMTAAEIMRTRTGESTTDIKDKEMSYKSSKVTFWKNKNTQ